MRRTGRGREGSGQGAGQRGSALGLADHVWSLEELENWRIGGSIGEEDCEGRSVKLSRQIWPWLIVSFLIAAASCFGPRIYPYDPILKVSLWMSGLGAVIVLAGVICERKQGLWLLVSAPLALFVQWLWFCGSEHVA